MLEPILGSKNAERVLMFVTVREQGYAREISTFWGADHDSTHKQLVRLEGGGVLVSKFEGRTKIYRFNPRYSFLKELKALLNKALLFYPEADREKLMITRKRPRRAGKPL